MSRQLPYSLFSQYPFQQQELHKRHPTAHRPSSAFSANANPSEDWTKVLNLAERRKLQNRIAQRNYRKKLKKRLEDIEHPTGFDSASPKQQALELPESGSVSSMHASPIDGSILRPTRKRSRRCGVTAQNDAILPSGDYGMLSRQCASLSGEDASANFATYSEPESYHKTPPLIDIPPHSSYIQREHQTYATGITIPPTKQDFDAKDDFSPFSISYASINGVGSSRTSQLPKYHHP